MFKVVMMLVVIVSIANPAWAEMGVDGVSPSLKDQEEMTVSVNLTSLTKNAVYYLKGAFQKEGLTNYFGETLVGTSWVKTGASKTDQLLVTTDDQGSWRGELKVRSDPTDSGFGGGGAYIFKIGRYTASGSSVTWSDPFPIQIESTVAPTPTSADPTEGVTPTAGETKEFYLTVSQTELIGEEEFLGSVRLSGLSPNSKYYLKGAFSKSGSTNYFGYTKVNSNFVKNSEAYTSQYEITTTGEGKWEGEMGFKADQSDSGFSASGDYDFKVGRYSNLGSGPTWSNVVSLRLEKTVVGNVAVSATIKPIKSPTPTKVASSANSSTAIGSQTTSTTKSPLTYSSKSNPTDSEAKVLDASTENTTSSGSAAVDLNIKDPTKQTTDSRLLLTGLVLLGAGGYFGFHKYRNFKNSTVDQSS